MPIEKPMTNPCFFPLPYDNSPLHNESWSRAKAYEGRKVIVTLRNGGTVRGRVRHVQTSGDRSRYYYGVGLMLKTGSEAYPIDRPIFADEFIAIEALREPDYIRV